MAYQIPNIAGLASARNNRRAQGIQKLGTQLAARQRAKNKREAAIVKDANARNVDFLKITSWAAFRSRTILSKIDRCGGEWKF